MPLKDNLFLRILLVDIQYTTLFTLLALLTTQYYITFPFPFEHTEREKNKKKKGKKLITLFVL